MSYGSITVSSISEGTYIVCGNEAQTIVCTNGGLVSGAQTIVIPFAGYIGDDRAACTVTYSTLPSGITLASGGNIAATTSADGSLTFNVANNGTLGNASTKTGIITLTFTCNEQTFVKKFSWSKAIAGNPGDNAITLSITSSNGTIFKNESIATTLTAHVYQGGTELSSTAINNLGTINWYKDGSTSSSGTGITFSITAGTVNQKATYEAKLSTIARDSITLATIRDVAATYHFYQLAASAPSKPTSISTIPPSGWSVTEPDYTPGETRDLYEVELTVFTDDTFNYSDVSKSIQYQAAKAAYTQSVVAVTAANAAEAKANKLLIDGEIIVGTQQSATNTWTGNASFSALQNGQTILYWLPYAGNSSAATLNLTLSDNTTTGAKNLYYGGTTRISNQYAAGSVIRLTYMENIAISGSGSYTGWWADANYDSNTNTYDRIRYQWAITARTAIAQKHIVVADVSTGKFAHLDTTAFDVTKPILYAADAIAVNATSTNTYLAIPDVPLATSKSGFTGTQYQTVYIVGTLEGNEFTPDSAIFTTTTPTTEDGKTYIALGQMQTTTNCYLYPEHPMYRYFNGKFQTISQLAYEAYIALDDTRNDLQGQITQNADATASNSSSIREIENIQTTFQADLDGIVGQVEGIEHGINGLDTRITTEMQQLADRFEFTFNTQSELEDMQKYIRFIDGSVYVGETGNELSLCISNNRISFLSGSSEVAYISQQRLYITDATFLQSIKIGNFAFVPRSSGNLSFKKIS